ncbi:RIO1 family-domain-containing protein [Rhodocollybia butyracea]|uniref:Serine/threonine-protein kinase RIO1 n=1 Tax=Rhodocollybia butyracea TaxID=206335 RepID=A0A9P5QBW7_9AGAR|nr:RIO1 family-domain-containing protein [Rhodocollybia butyracea]
MSVGQFDDAPEVIDPRAGFSYIDSSEESDDLLDNEEEEGEEIEETYEDDRVEDEDWENAERDFTKQYNRLRQHVAVRSGNAQGTTSSLNQSTSVAALPALNHPRSNAAKPIPGPQAKDKSTDQLAALSKYNSRLAKIDIPYVIGVGVNRKGPSASANLKDKSDRATNEQVLDPRTRLILFKMIGRELIHEVNGCVSTGKEANVYHALTPDLKHLALKIYKTSILVFKDRDKYVTGEYRFRRGYSRKNPRKMVRLWAEKEMRNLKRLVSAGIRCPDPVEVRENVLVMTFLGDKEGWAAPRLKDAELTITESLDLYVELVLAVRKMFHQCKLVHADLSEYNILFHEGHLWIIDVSQSVEHDHPSAFDFLRKDLSNVEEFFGRLGVHCLGLRRVFEFVITENLSCSSEGLSEEDILRKRMEEALSDENTAAENSKESAAHEDSIFKQSYIPRSLNELYDPERDVAVVTRGEGAKLIYADTIGLIESPAAEVREEPTGQTSLPPVVRFSDDKGTGSEVYQDASESGPDSDLNDDVEGESDDAGSAGAYEERKPRGHRHEDRDAKKVGTMLIPRRFRCCSCNCYSGKKKSCQG